jgi:cell division protease FtsH
MSGNGKTDPQVVPPPSSLWPRPPAKATVLTEKPGKAAESPYRIEDLPEEESGYADDPSKTAPGLASSHRPSAMDAILTAAFGAAVSSATRRRLLHSQGLAVVFVVPTAAWVGPASAHFQRTYGQRWVRIVRDGSSKGMHKATVGSDESASDLARGRCVVGIAADVGILPRALTLHVDITIRLQLPTGRTIEKAIARFTGRRPAALTERHAAGLDLYDLIAAFRPGSGAQVIADRLASAAAFASGASPGEALPLLADAVEYGKARDWGMGLARDIADYRLNLVNWSDIPSRGLVLEGEPGLGKSLYAGMLAEACNLPLIRTSVSEWFMRDSYLHNTIQAVQEVFERAAVLAPALIFLDEADALPNRATVGDRNKDYWKPLINFLLLKLDNAISSTREGIIVVAATNDASDLDAALVRPGRLERIIRIERPDLVGTLHILEHHVRGDIPAGDIEEFACMIERSTGAEIMQIVRESRRIARQAGRPLEIADLRAALAPQQELAPNALWRIAVHEAGHAVGALALPYGDLRRCMIGQRGNSGGHTAVEALDDDLPTLETVEDRVTMTLCGRAAERAILLAGSLGDRSDLESATRNMAMIHGESGLGNTISYLGNNDQILELLRTDRALRRHVERDLRRLEARAEDIIRSHRDAVIAVAAELRRKRQLSGDEVRAIFEATRGKETAKEEGAAC